MPQDLATDCIRQWRPLVEQVHRRDRGLADQLRRAASSGALNLAEAAHSTAGNRRLRLETARGSANETRACLSVAVAWGYVGEADALSVDAGYDHVMAMAYRLWSRA